MIEVGLKGSCTALVATAEKLAKAIPAWKAAHPTPADMAVKMYADELTRYRELPWYKRIIYREPPSFRRAEFYTYESDGRVGRVQALEYICNRILFTEKYSPQAVFKLDEKEADILMWGEINLLKENER